MLTVNSCIISSSTPESLGLKHLAIRPKKQQLIEDQRQKVAKENAKLMSGMTKVAQHLSFAKFDSILYISVVADYERAAATTKTLRAAESK